MTKAAASTQGIDIMEQKVKYATITSIENYQSPEEAWRAYFAILAEYICNNHGPNGAVIWRDLPELRSERCFDQDMTLYNVFSRLAIVPGGREKLTDHAGTFGSVFAAVN